MCRDPTIWSNADDYDPDRFERKEDAVPNAWIPFSGGIHVCPGRYIAVQMLKAYACTLFTLLNLEIIGKSPEMNYERATLAQRSSPAMLRFSYNKKVLI